MSKATFEEALESRPVTAVAIGDMIALIERHGGHIVWPVETPAGDVCMCPDDHKAMLEKHGEWAGEKIDFSQKGPWHNWKTCPLHVPF